MARVEFIVDLTRQRLSLRTTDPTITAIINNIASGAGLSGGTIRNYLKGIYPTVDQFDKLDSLDAWARREYPRDYPAAGDETTLSALARRTTDTVSLGPGGGAAGDVTIPVAVVPAPERERQSPGSGGTDPVETDGRGGELGGELGGEQGGQQGGQQGAVHEPTPSAVGVPVAFPGEQGPDHRTPRLTPARIATVVALAAVVGGGAWAVTLSGDGDEIPAEDAGSNDRAPVRVLTFDSLGGGEEAIKVYPGVLNVPEDKEPSGTYNNGDTVPATCWIEGREIRSDPSAGETRKKSTIWVSIGPADDGTPRFATLTYSRLDTDYRKLPPCEGQATNSP